MSHDVSTSHVQEMSSDRIYWEWVRGCTNTFVFGLPPWKCQECTEAMMGALRKAMERERIAEEAP